MSAIRAPTRRGRRPPVAPLAALATALGLAAGCFAGAARAAETDSIVAALALEPGMTVADVGAGDGDFTVALASRLGPAGRVIATEIEDDLVEKIRRRAKKDDLVNVEVVLGTQDDLALPPGCCDGVLVRLVYHHFEQPARMRAGLAAALKPGGRLAIVDIQPQSGWRELPGVPDRGGHGIPLEALVAEMVGDGFEVVETHAPWAGNDERFCVVFRVAGAAAPAAGSPETPE